MHWLNVHLSIVNKDKGSEICFKDEHLQNEDSPSFTNDEFSSNLTSVNDIQSEKEKSFIFLTEEGIVICFNNEHWSNA